MGEILRAVLQSECVTSRPKFYGGRMTLPIPAQTPTPISTVTTFDKTAWFLITSIFVGGIGFSGGIQPGLNGPGSLLMFNTQMTLENVQSREQYFAGPNGGALGVFIGSFQSNPVELEEYILMAPGQRMKWSCTAWNIPFAVQAAYFDICYAGIEFVMPKEASAYGA